MSTSISADLRDALLSEMRTMSTAGTGIPDTPEGMALARARWLESLYYVVYDELKFHGYLGEHESLGPVGDALMERSDALSRAAGTAVPQD